MLRAWAGIAILATSWLLGLNYYHQADMASWALLVAIGTALLLGALGRLPQRGESSAAAVLLLPVILYVPWPWRLMFVLLFASLTLLAFPIPRRWPKVVCGGLLLTGTILIAQSLAMVVYEAFTARCQELPGPLVRFICGIARLTGIDAGMAGHEVVLPSMRQVHPIAATWGLLLDPPTFCFLAGGLAMLALLARAELPPGRRHSYLLRSGMRLVLCVAAWLPIRCSLMMALYLHQVLRTDYDAPLTVVTQLWNTWLHLGLLAGPVLIAWRFVHSPTRPAGFERTITSTPLTRSKLLAGLLAFAAAVALTASILWTPVGPRKAGRILVDEYHSTWEPTERPFDTTWYGNESGYNFACIYDYCSRFYDMSRLTKPIDNSALVNVDVLMLKVPNRSSYDATEVEAIVKYVESGGGLLLIGEHTDVFKTGTHLNDVARRFGFEFRYDCLFGVDSAFEQRYEKPWVPHPIVQSLPPLDFAVSCSIDPRLSAGRAAIVGTGLKSLSADYHASNFYPQAKDQPEMRYGAFVQLWTTQQGAGRVAAFTDSTQFSNFCVFDPGKSELMMGMLEWLNHQNGPGMPRTGLIVVGVLLLFAGWLASRRLDGAWMMLLSACILGWLVSGLTVKAIHASTCAVPQPVKPMVRVVFDRTVCDAGLSTNGFTAGKADEFGLFERWVLRLGWFTTRSAGNDVFKGDLVVFLNPNQSVSPTFRQQLVEYIENGGRALIVDMPANTKSTANSLLYPFGLTVDHTQTTSGPLNAAGVGDQVPIEASCAIKGGQPWAHVQNIPVAATAPHGKGTVSVIGFGSRFSDSNMGITGDLLPDAAMQKVYNLEYAMFRGIMSDVQASQPTSRGSLE